MAASSDTILCASCELTSSTTKPKPGIVNCIGCQKIFCIHHIGEHRQKLSAELESIVCQRNMIQEALESASFDVSTELAVIDTWVKETIELVYKAAADARQKLESLVIKCREGLKSKCQKLKSQIESFQQSENYFERDLANLKTSLDQLAIAKDKLNIKLDCSDVGYALDKAIQMNSDGCAPDIGIGASFIEKLLLSAKPDRQISLGESCLGSVTVFTSGAILIDDYEGFLLVDSDGSMRNLSRGYKFIQNICWSTQLNLFLYYVLSSHSEPTKLISFDPSVTRMRSEQVVTPKTQGDIKKITAFKNSLLLVCQFRKSTQTIEEWSLDGKQWYQAEQPKCRWRSPLSCLEDEYIENIAFDENYIAVIIRTDKPFNSFRFELRSRKMTILGHVPLNMQFLFTLAPRCKLQRVPDGWLFNNAPSYKELVTFVLISNDLNIYEQSHLNHLELADVALVDEDRNKKKLLVTHYYTRTPTSSKNKSQFLFYEIK
jgi:hypothetical protein